jgi:hypothetical protein
MLRHGDGGTAWDHVFLAMVHARRGDAGAAADMLERASRWHAEHAGELSCYQRAEFGALLDEARRVLAAASAR